MNANKFIYNTHITAWVLILGEMTNKNRRIIVCAVIENAALHTCTRTTKVK